MVRFRDEVQNESMWSQLMRERLRRREALLRLGTAAGVVPVGLGALATAGCSAPQSVGGHGAPPTTSPPVPLHALATRGTNTANNPFSFVEVAAGADTMLHVPAGYTAQVLVADGDPILPGGAAWAPASRSADQAERQFGSNADFTAFLPLPAGSGRSDHGLLCVNHEHPTTRMLFADLEGCAGIPEMAAKMSRERAELELAVVGHSVVEVKRGADGAWSVVAGGAWNRRITARSTLLQLRGPAAGHRRMQTAADPEGRSVIGTFHNCSGGVTPWGTVLIGEENFDGHFIGTVDRHPEAAAMHRNHFADGSGWPWWGQHVPRFDFDKEPLEVNRFGWVVEIDPYDPSRPPVKRTALGRFSHEAATSVVAPDGRLVVYLGDDKHGEYLYRFVSARAVDTKDRAANRDLLDDGVLSVAKFDADGSLRWMPLQQGVGPLTVANGFHDQGDVVIDARRAADLLGATPLDRPEDVEAQPGTGVVIVALTNHSRRKEAGPGNPRDHNVFGHLLALFPPGAPGAAADPTASLFRWEVALLGGNPTDPTHRAPGHPKTSEHGWVASPDNLAFDPKGRLWVACDQGSHWTVTGRADGLFATVVDGDAAFWTQLFLRAPTGAEVAGPSFTPDGATLFCSIQHPGADVQGSSYGRPATRWPDFDPARPPRAAVVAIRRDDGGPIGG